MAGRDDEGTEGVLSSRPRTRKLTPCGSVRRGNRHPVSQAPPPEPPEPPFVDTRYRVVPPPSPGPPDRPIIGTRYRAARPPVRDGPEPSPSERIREARQARSGAAPVTSPGVRVRERRQRGTRRSQGWRLPIDSPFPPRPEDQPRTGEPELQIQPGRAIAEGRVHTFRAGSVRQLHLAVTGERAGATTFYLWVFKDDDFSQVIVDPPPVFTVPAGTDDWTDVWRDPPDDELGFYRVVVVDEGDPTAFQGDSNKLAEFHPPALTMPNAGTRPANHFTYAVVPDPDSRPAAPPPVARTFFGLQGAHEDQPVLPWLGVRWLNQDRYQWRRHPNPDSGDNDFWPGWFTGRRQAGTPNAYYWWMDPDRPGHNLGAWDAFDVGVPAGSTWGVHTMPPLFVTGLGVDRGGGPPAGGLAGWMNNLWGVPGPVVEGSYGLSGRGGRPNAEGVEAWAGYAYHSAKKFSREHPTMDERVYQVTWEPDAFYGYRGEAIVPYGSPVPIGAGWLIGEATALALEGLGQIYGVAHRQVRDGELSGAGQSRAVLIGPTSSALYRAGAGGVLNWDPWAPPSQGFPNDWFFIEDPTAGYRNSPYFTQRDIMLQPVLDREGNMLEDDEAPGLPLRVVDVLDGFSIHPYVRGTSLSNESGFAGEYLDEEDNLMPVFDEKIVAGVRELREQLTALRAERGRGPLPMYATEFGFRTNTGEPTETYEAAREKWFLDRTQALALVREALILLGEGFRMGMAFTARDYAKEAGSGVEVLQYGLYYNLEEGIYSNDDTWKSGELAPRPAASAFAATTFTLEGFRPVPAWNAVLEGEYGPDGIRIYAFGRGEDVVLALWHPEGQRLIEGLPSFLSLRFGVQADPAGTDPSLVDWMGNPASVSWGPFSRFRVGPEPVYITGLRRPQLSRSGLPLRGGAVRIEPDEPFEPFEW